LANGTEQQVHKQGYVTSQALLYRIYVLRRFGVINWLTKRNHNEKLLLPQTLFLIDSAVVGNRN